MRSATGRFPPDTEDHRFPPDRETGLRRAMVQIIGGPDDDGDYEVYVEGTVRDPDNVSMVDGDAVYPMPPGPPTLAEAVAWLRADEDNTVEWWSARTGIWNVHVHDDPYFWRYQVADYPVRADEPQPGYRLATRPPPIRPEVQAVRDLGDLSDAEAKHLDATLDARLRDSFAEDVDPQDPWETCKVGDPEPGDVWPGGFCEAPIDPGNPNWYVCTRPVGHSGRHVAVGVADYVAAVEKNQP